MPDAHVIALDFANPAGQTLRNRVELRQVIRQSLVMAWRGLL